ncbi:NAD-dependent epimerase/dehydratase family protein [Dactylosporangium sp. CA-092794]|uniref:NAD-dependent epimerase/dehydratase family protein n=1 Tax=Dactylosporangium sp. CA-092794 TaxID=3239929 RepID=UPI003D92752D
MRILILGGTVFLGRAVARQALAAGHEVLCAARGESGAPVGGARFVRVDRDEPDGLSAVEGEFDAVVDVARHPHHVRHAVTALAGRAGHYTLVSTGSVYADVATPHQTAATAPLLPPDHDADPAADPESYGRAKVACERLAAGGFGAGRTLLLRAGLIVGPEDPTGRFDYWVRRYERGGEVLAPGGPDESVQLVDVRDLADWILTAAGRGLAGPFDGVGAPMTRAEFHAGLAAGTGTAPPLTWVTQEFLLERGVVPWAGPRSLPLWLPLPRYAGFMSRDAGPSLAAGLRIRPLAETVRDTRNAFRDATHIDESLGLGIDEETALLREWHAR